MGHCRENPYMGPQKAAWSLDEVGNRKSDYSNLGAPGALMNQTPSSESPVLQAGTHVLSPRLRSMYHLDLFREEQMRSYQGPRFQSQVLLGFKAFLRISWTVCFILERAFSFWSLLLIGSFSVPSSIIIFVLGHCLSVTQLSEYSGLWISLLFKAINYADLRIEEDFRKIHTFLSKIQRILTYFGHHLAWILDNILSVGKIFSPTLSYLKC